jgi:cytochrome c5
LSTHDQKFFDVFILVIGILVAITVGLIITARSIGAATQTQWVREYPIYDKEVAERLQPAGHVALPGEPGADEQPAAGAVAATAAPVAAPLSGPQVFNQACNACHGAGIGGAPKFGDKAAWAPRIAQGVDTLHKHALEGFQGKSGVMPQKGGWVNLSDAEITAAVDYMVSQSK